MNRRWRSIRRSFLSGLLAPLGVLALASTVAAQVGTVQSEQKISETEGGFGGVLEEVGEFGVSVCSVGDLDGDGNADLAVGAPFDDGGGADEGAVWILFLNADGTVASEQKISEAEGGFGGALDTFDAFGVSLTSLGDLDGDGNNDLAVGAPSDDDGGGAQGAVWILFLNSDGTVADQQKISETEGGFGGVLDPVDFFGTSVASLGDLDGDSSPELAVGAFFDDDGGTDQGAVWILFLNPDGTVASEQKISETTGGFSGGLDADDFFGEAVSPLGDLDGDGIGDLAVGAAADDGGEDQGAVWILFLNADGTVADQQKISETTGGFGGVLDPFDFFGRSVGSLGDLDGDGIQDLAVGAADDDGGFNQGAVWILFLNADGTVADQQKISETAGGFGGALDPSDFFGIAVNSLGDLDGDGNQDLAVGAYLDDDGGNDRGAVWILFLEGNCPRLDFETEDDFATPLVNGQHIDTEFGDLVSITSSGPNAGLAIFDSTPGGPNDPSQDRDLLVGTGKILILQTENFPPDANDVFPRPNDDEDGGTMSFAFTVPVTAASLRLIDIDAGDGATTVVLTDSSARERVYTVPSNWTGDLLLSQPGQRVLDLATLAPQPGFGSIATATEDGGFDPVLVVQLDVHLDGSGGIDDVAWCPTSLPRASAIERHGSGTNTVRLTSLSLPVLGSVWHAELDCTGYGSGVATLEVRRWPTTGPTALFGELLIGGALVHHTAGAFSASPRTLGWSIPNDMALCGLDVHAQGLCTSASTPRRKTMHLRGGLSNAIDLVLGF